jgi:hypothetical protein
VSLALAYLILLSEDHDLGFFLSLDRTGYICRAIAAVLDTAENSLV